MNKYDIQRARVENIKRMYPPGTRIELISMSDPYAPVPSGTKGTVSFVDDTTIWGAVLSRLSIT